MRMKKIFVALSILFFLGSLSMAFVRQQVDPVNWRDLVPFLIDIEGWDAEGDAEGASMNMGSFMISQAEREYNAGDKTLTIQIVDGAFAPMVYAGIKMAMSFEVDSSEEYIKKIEVNGYPAIEKYNYEENDAETIVLVADRFLVNLKGENFTDEEAPELAQIAGTLDLEGLAQLSN